MSEGNFGRLRTGSEEDARTDWAPPADACCGATRQKGAKRDSNSDDEAVRISKKSNITARMSRRRGSARVCTQCWGATQVSEEHRSTRAEAGKRDGEATTQGSSRDR